MRTGLLAVLALGILSGPARAGDGGLEIERLTISAKGNVKITARFDPADVPLDFDLHVDGAAVRIDGEPVAEFDQWSPLPRGFEFLEETREPALRRVRLDLGQGRLVVRAKRLPRPVVGFSEVVVSLRLGETMLTDCVKTEWKGKRAKFRGEPAPKPGGDLEYETLASRQIAGSDACGVAVARDAVQLAELAAALDRELPAVDFETEMAVLLRVGFRPSGCYGIEVLRVRERGDGAHVVLREYRPGRRCMCTAVALSPWALVRLPRRDGPVTASVKVRKFHCR